MAGLNQILEFVLKVDDNASAKFNQIGKNAQSSLGAVTGHTSKLGTAIDAAAAKSPLLAKGLDKVGLSGQQAGSMIGAAMPTAALAASAAVGAFAVKAVVDFQKLSLAVLDFQRASGATAEESSQFVAVLDDYGIAAEVGARAMQTLGRNAANVPEKFARFGIEIAKNADGSTNLAATLLNAAEAYQASGDASQKAAIAAALFGARGGKELIPLLEKGADGAHGLAAAFAEINGQQIFTQGQLDQAQETDLALDRLRDSVHELSLALGSSLSPAVSQFAQLLSSVVDVANTALGPVGGLDSAVGFLVESALSGGPVLKEVREGIEGLVTPSNEAALSAEDIAFAMSELDRRAMAVANSTDEAAHALAMGMTPAWIVAESATANAAIALDEAADAAEAAAAASKAVDDALRSEAEAHRDAAAAITERADAMRSAADKTFAVRSATDEFADAVSSLSDDMASAAESGTSNEDALRNQGIVLDEGTQKADEMAQAVVDLATEQSAAVGITSTAVDQTDLWNQTMVDAASTAEGPLRDAIVGYIGEVNQIPPEKVSEILALIAQGDLDAAKALLDDASAKRTAEIEAQAETAAANSALDAIASKKRTAYINVRTVNETIAESQNANKMLATGGNRSLGTGRAAAEQTEMQRGLNVALRATTNAVDEHNEAMSKAFDVVLAARKAELDYQAAIAGSDNQLESYTATMQDADASAADRVKAGIDLEKQLQAEAEKFVQMQEALAEANGETYTAEQQVADYNSALGMLANRLPHLADLINGYAISLEDLVGTIDEVALAQAAAEAATEAATEAYEAQQDALNDHTSDVLDALQAERDYAAAVLDTRQEIADYQAILADPEATADEKARAKIELANQVDAEADAWVRLKEAQAEANGVEFTAEDRIKAYNDALKSLNDRNRGGGVTFGSGPQGGSGGSFNPIGQLGTPLSVANRAGSTLVREAAYNITVNAGLGSNGTQIGNELVRVLREWERSNGTAWRNN